MFLYIMQEHKNIQFLVLVAVTGIDCQVRE